jgi:hypothetical protein
LLGFEAWVDFVDDVNPAFTAHDLARSMACFQGFDRAFDFHGRIPLAAQTGARASFRNVSRAIRRQKLTSQFKESDFTAFYWV